MATIAQVLAQADELEPSPYSDTVKAAWLEELDGKLAAEVLRREPPAYPPNEWDAALLVEAPYDNLYVHYVVAMVCYHNQEIDRYNNAMMMFQQSMGEFRKWYNREHRPERTGGFINTD